MLKLKRAGAINEVFYPRVVGQHGGGEEEKWEMVGVCRLHGFK